MKKLICLFLSILLTVSFSLAPVYAEKNSKGKSNESWKHKADADDRDDDDDDDDDERWEKKNFVREKKEDSKVDVKTIEWFREQLKKNHRNKEIRKELVKKIAKLRKENRDNTTPVFIKGKELVTDTPPVIKDGRTLIPVRAVTNALGAEVGWYSETRTVTVTKTVYGGVYGEKSISIQIKLESDIVFVNGKEVKIDVPAQIVNERTFVPLRFIAETFKQNVDWDDETGSVIIEDEDDTTQTPAPITTPTPTPIPSIVPSVTPTPAPAQ